MFLSTNLASQQVLAHLQYEVEDFERFDVGASLMFAHRIDDDSSVGNNLAYLSQTLVNQLQLQHNSNNIKNIPKYSGVEREDSC